MAVGSGQRWRLEGVEFPHCSCHLVSTHNLADVSMESVDCQSLMISWFLGRVAFFEPFKPTVRELERRRRVWICPSQQLLPSKLEPKPLDFQALFTQLFVLSIELCFHDRIHCCSLVLSMLASSLGFSYASFVSHSLKKGLGVQGVEHRCLIEVVLMVESITRSLKICV